MAATTSPLPLLAAALAALAVPAVAQCNNLWRPGYGCPGVDATILSMTRWDPDGAGPAPEQVAMSGFFAIAGDVAVQGFATWSPSTRTFATLPPPPGCISFNGQLAIGPMTASAQGELLVAYNASATTMRVARWSGGPWTVLGGDFDSAIGALLLVPSGELVAAGAFGTVGAVVTPGIARWNGTAWQAIGTGFACTANALANGPAGEILVAGSVGFGTAPPVRGVASWNGVAWSMIGSAFTGINQSPVTVASVGGQRYVATLAGDLFRLVSGAWVQVNGGPTRCSKLQPSANGQLCVLGDNLNYVIGGGLWAPWFGTLTPSTGAWASVSSTPTLLPSQPGQYRSLVELTGGGFVLGGSIREFGNAAHWNGQRWQALGDGPGEGVRCAAAIDDEQFYLGGSFRTAGGSTASGVARWDGSTWHRLRGLEADVADLALLPNGDLIAGGAFAFAGASGVTVGLARWNGSSWSEFGGVAASGSIPEVTSLLQRRNGDLVVAGEFTDVAGVACSNVASWNGSTWNNLAGGVAAPIVAIAEGPTGNLLVATGHQVLELQGGTAWIPLSTTTHTITDLAVLPDGRVVTTGHELTSPFGVLVHSAVVDVAGLHHVDLGSSKATGLVALPNGDLLASGNFAFLTQGTTTLFCPTSCVRIPADVNSPLIAGPDVGNLVDADVFPNGDRLLVASTIRPGSTVWKVGRLSTTCPAGAVSLGSGCNANALVATSLPWLGATARATATGLPTNSIAIDVLGLGATSVPLGSLLPIGQPGCNLLVSPDLFGALLPTAGQVEVALPLPNNLALVGAVLHRQVLALAVSPAGAPRSLTSTNALQLTIGAF